jgi:phosphatidylglycerophosphatase A
MSTSPSTKPAAPSAAEHRVSPVWLAWATWFGAGLSPKAPGTVGSAASLVLWGPLVLLDVPWLARLLAVVAVFFLGVAAAQKVVDVRGEDPQIVVIDEVAGMGVALLFAPPAVWTLIVGFVLFRVFDIAKPWPVSWADQRVGGGLGVMLDDIIAGLYALAVFVGAWLVVARFAPPDVASLEFHLPRILP